MLLEDWSCIIIQSFIVVYKIPQRPSCQTQTRKLVGNSSSSDNVAKFKGITKPQTNSNLRYDKAELHRSRKEAKQTRRATILLNRNVSRKKSRKVDLTEGPFTTKGSVDDPKITGG